MKKLKSWPMWMLMGILTVSLLAVGTKRVACPTCDGESVFVSRASAAEAIRKQVAREVAAGEKSDTEIIGSISDSFNAQILLVPRATGLDSLVWVLPIAVLVCAVAGLAMAFRKWRKQNTIGATGEDFELVNKLLAQGEDPTDDENV
jgi:cytochrome c-type biogenesis protein CcmH